MSNDYILFVKIDESSCPIVMAPAGMDKETYEVLAAAVLSCMMDRGADLEEVLSIVQDTPLSRSQPMPAPVVIEGGVG